MAGELNEALSEFYGLGEGSPGASQCALDALAGFDRQTRADLARRLLPTGGSACLASFDAILAQSLAARARLRFEFLANDRRADAAFNGAALLAALRDSNCYVTRRDFEEGGLHAIARRLPLS